jgi:hypothetical protein
MLRNLRMEGRGATAPQKSFSAEKDYTEPCSVS